MNTSTKTSLLEKSELISMLYRIEQVLANFCHVAHLQNVVNAESIEKARKKLENEYDKQSQGIY